MKLLSISNLPEKKNDFVDPKVNIFSKQEKIKGKFYEKMDHFVVEEVSLDKKVAKVTLDKFGVHNKIKKDYIKMILIKRGISTVNAIKKIANLCNIPENQIKYSGFKDTFGLTGQWISISSKYFNKIEKGYPKLKEYDIKLSMPYYSSTECKIRGLFSNHFKITVIPEEDIKIIFQKLKHIKDILKIQKIPNYYGSQRFGKNQKNHFIGKCLLKKDFEEAVKALCIISIKTESEKIIALRRRIKMHWGNWEKILNFLDENLLPDEMKIIKSLFEGKNYLDSLNILGFANFYLSSFSSYIFNATLSSFISSETLESIPEKMPLVGNSIKLGKSKLDLYFKKLLEKEGVKIKDFSNENSILDLRGRMKNTFYTISNFDFKISEGKVIISFTLPMGTYANIFLESIIIDSVGGSKLE